MSHKFWDAIVLTCQDHDHAQAFLDELYVRQRKGMIEKETLLLSIEDPTPQGGSGCATLNALTIVSEHLSAQSGLTVMSSEVLMGKRILILHVGVHFPFSGSCQGFLTFPSEVYSKGPTASSYHGLACMFDVALYQLETVVAKDSPPGLWVWSLDRLIVIPRDTVVDWSKDYPVRFFIVPADEDDIVEKHGACELGADNIIQDIVYQGSYEQLLACKLPDGRVLAVTGLVYMNTAFTETLLNLQVTAPLDSCTYYGIDNGAHGVKNLSLIFDILLACAIDISEKDFIRGRRTAFHSVQSSQEMTSIDRVYRREARAELWKALNGYRLKGELVMGGAVHFLSCSPLALYQLLSDCPYADHLDKKHFNFSHNVHSLFKDDIVKKKDIVAVNSIFEGVHVGPGSVVYHSHLEGNCKFGRRNFIMNIGAEDLQCLPVDFTFGDNLFLFSINLKLKVETTVENSRHILAILGIKDDVERCILDPNSTFCNQPWDLFFERTKIQASELWTPEIKGKDRCLLNARLFPIFNPHDDINILDLLWLQGGYHDEEIIHRWRSSCRLSLQETRKFSRASPEFHWRRNLYFKIGKLQAVQVLEEQQPKCLVPFFRSCTKEGYFEDIMEALDNVALSTTSTAVLSRTFACMADVLGAKASTAGGLRSGPAANSDWRHGLRLLEENKVSEAVTALAHERTKWVSRPDLLIRAARHYEGAFQVQVRKAVATARQFVKLSPCEPTKIGETVIAEAPARMDVAGTWSDTPPICYEHGGAVVTIALKMEGKRPIVAKVRKIAEPKIVLKLGFGEDPIVLNCTALDHLLTYSRPNSPGALLKAAFFCADVLSLDGSTTLEKQLQTRYGCGFELQTGTDLPQGSGLGTSSILAATVLAALWRAVGFEPDRNSIVHAVLVIEQMMTTGGGWQDQVGGVQPGIKVGQCRDRLPLQVDSVPIQVPDGFLETLQRHIVLIFTGKTRLARNMLQDVLRNWNGRLPEITRTADQLIKNAENCIKALNEGDLAGIGRCLSVCWEHKKEMAHGCEPRQCKILMDALRPLMHGQCLAGAGGGGFSYAITKDPDACDKIRETISKIEGLTVKPRVYQTTIDSEGMVVRVEGEKAPCSGVKEDNE